MLHRILPSAAAILALAPLGAAETAPATSWQQVGWGGGAYYYGAAWHPTDANMIYLSGDCAGAYTTTDKGLNWRFANNGIGNYAAFNLAVGPAAPDHVYVLTEGGLAKSTDRAKTWQVLAETTPKKLNITCTKGGSVRPVALDPRNPAIVYAGSKTGKLFKTTDGGTTWAELPYRDVLPKPAEPPAFLGKGALRLVYETTTGGLETMGRASRFYGQGKAAKDWSAYSKLSLRFRLPEQAPTVQAQLVAQTGPSWAWQPGAWVDGKAGEWVELALDLSKLKDTNAVDMLHVLLRSPQAAWQGEVLIDAMALFTDPAGTLTAGQAPDGKAVVLIADWEKAGDTDGWKDGHDAKDMPHITAAHHSLAKKGGDVVSTVAVATTEPATVFVSNTRHGIFRSDDAGASWTVLDTPKKALGVTIAATDANIVWAACGEDGIYHSADRGRTWAAVTCDSSKKPSICEIALHPARPGLVYAIGSIGWGGGLYRSDDAGTTWKMSNKVRIGLPGNPTIPNDNDGSKDGATGIQGLSTIKNIAVNPANPDEMLIAGNWRIVFSGDGGKTLEERSTGADNTCATDIQFLGGKTYVTAMDEGLLVSDNNGGEWRQLIPLKWDNDVSGHFWRVRAAKVGDAVRLVTTASPWQSYGNPKCANRAYVSQDDGRSFTRSLGGLPDYVPNRNCMWGRSFPRALAIDPKNPDILYLGMDGDPEPGKADSGGGVFRSADGGKSWTRCAGQPGGRRMFYGLAVDPTDSKRIFWSCCGSGGGVWRSEDAGATWEHVFKTEAWCFNLDITAAGSVLVGGKNLHRSTDHGKTWSKLTNFTTDHQVCGIAMDPADEQRLWISRTTWDSSDQGGIYATRDGGTTWQDITGDIPCRKPQLLRYNADTRELWAGGVGLFTMKP